jgi:hypothetical protein
MTSERFDKASAQALSAQVEAELAAFGERMGLKIHSTGGMLDGSRFVMKLSFDIAGVDKAAEDFRKHARTFGLQEDDLGKEIKIGSRTFAITGLRTSGKGSQSAPVLARDTASGKDYLFKVAQVKSALGRAVAAWEKT